VHDNTGAVHDSPQVRLDERLGGAYHHGDRIVE